MKLLDAVTDEPEVKNSCEHPCDPEKECEECAAYWERMKQEGYWEGGNHRWTEKGWREITK